ncbi:hypothetical protein [Saccharomonospora azurea]|uniref:hypothetical protein n=1 Tax=Saccharomonospora azurea TaxID=40988 RepID=UPI003D917F37
MAFACIGFLSIVGEVGLQSAMPGLSQQASLFTAIVYTGLLLYPAFAGGRRHERRSPWWRGATAVLGPPLAYLVYFLAADVGRYGSFLDPDDDAFALTVLGFLAAVLAAGYLLYGCAKVKALATTSAPSPQPPLRY